MIILLCLLTFIFQDCGSIQEKEPASTKSGGQACYLAFQERVQDSHFTGTPEEVQPAISTSQLWKCLQQKVREVNCPFSITNGANTSPQDSLEMCELLEVSQRDRSQLQTMWRALDPSPRPDICAQTPTTCKGKSTFDGRPIYLDLEFLACGFTSRKKWEGASGGFSADGWDKSYYGSNPFGNATPQASPFWGASSSAFRADAGQTPPWPVQGPPAVPKTKPLVMERLHL